MHYMGGVLEQIPDSMSGGEATVYIQLRDTFPGIGGTIKTNKGVLTAYRESHSPTPKHGHRIFLRHMVIKKLEDLFQRTRNYHFSHIPRPMGSFSDPDEGVEGYLYEYARGSDGFAWYVSLGQPDYNKVLLKMKEWNEFTSLFLSTGIDLRKDIADPDNGDISKNVIHEFGNIPYKSLEYNSIWKRIDFGSGSIGFDIDKIRDFIERDREHIKQVLTFKRVELMLLALEYLRDPFNMDPQNIGRLDSEVGAYRRSSLEHLAARGSGVVDEITHIEERPERL